MPENEGQKFGDALFDDRPAFVFLHFRAHEGKLFAAVGKLYPRGVGQRRKAREVRVLRVVPAHIEVAGELETGQTVRQIGQRVGHARPPFAHGLPQIFIVPELTARAFAGAPGLVVEDDQPLFAAVQPVQLSGEHVEPVPDGVRAEGSP